MPNRYTPQVLQNRQQQPQARKNNFLADILKKPASYYVGPHLGQGLKNIGSLGRLATEFLPSADIRDALTASKDTMQSLRQGRLGKALVDAAYIPASMAGLVIPGSVGGIKKGTEQLELALKEAKAPTPKPKITAYHGSPHDFSEFKFEKIGTGEGHQAFGHGLYFTDSEDIAKFYKQKLEGDIYKTSDGKIFDPHKMRDDGNRVIQNLNVRAALSKNKGDVNKAIERAEEVINHWTPGNNPLVDGYEDMEDLQGKILEMTRQDLSLLKDIKASGGLEKKIGKVYKVDIKTVTDDLIDYDKPLGQQNKNIKKILDKMKSEVTVEDAINYGLDPNDPGSNLFLYVNKNSSKETIEKEAIKQTQKVLFSKDQEVVRFLNDWAVLRGEQSSAETLLAKYGAKGIKYKANQGVGARNVPETGKNNYVIFDPKIINILAKYGIVGAVGVSAVNKVAQQPEQQQPIL